MVKIVPYKADHAYQVLDKNVKDFDLQLSKLKDWESWTKEWETAGPSYSLFVDDKIIGCGGVILFGYNRGECWMLVSSEIKKYKKTVFKAVKEHLDLIVKTNNLRRLQTVVVADYEDGKKFIERLGFKPEGLLKKYGPNGEDFLMYART